MAAGSEGETCPGELGGGGGGGADELRYVCGHHEASRSTSWGSRCVHRAGSVCSGGGNGGVTIQGPGKEEGMGRFVFPINDDLGRRKGALRSLARIPSGGSSGGVGR